VAPRYWRSAARKTVIISWIAASPSWARTAISTAARMIGDHQQGYFTAGSRDCVELLHLFEAVAVGLDHLLQAAHLPFDAARAAQDGLLLFRRALEALTARRRMHTTSSSPVSVQLLLARDACPAVVTHGGWMAGTWQGSRGTDALLDRGRAVAKNAEEVR
jgi:hypothetical protein